MTTTIKLEERDRSKYDAECHPPKTDSLASFGFYLQLVMLLG